MVQSRKIVCKKLSTNFRECTEIVAFNVPALKADQVLVQVKYVGINASDINYTNGAYLPGVQPPFDCGFEAVGVVVDVGSGVKKLRKGDAVASMCTSICLSHCVWCCRYCYVRLDLSLALSALTQMSALSTLSITAL